MPPPPPLLLLLSLPLLPPLLLPPLLLPLLPLLLLLRPLLFRASKRVVEERVSPALTLAMRALYQSRAGRLLLREGASKKLKAMSGERWGGWRGVVGVLVAAWRGVGCCGVGGGAGWGVGAGGRGWGRLEVHEGHWSGAWGQLRAGAWWRWGEVTPSACALLPHGCRLVLRGAA